MKDKPVAITTAWMNLILGLLIIAEAAFLFWGSRCFSYASDERRLA